MRSKLSIRTSLPLRIKIEAVMRLSSLKQFHGIPDETLIRLAERRTRLSVPDRWVAIALILGNRVPIPVPLQQQRGKEPHPTTPSPKLTVIIGGRLGR